MCTLVNIDLGHIYLTKGKGILCTLDNPLPRSSPSTDVLLKYQPTLSQHGVECQLTRWPTHQPTPRQDRDLLREGSPANQNDLWHNLGRQIVFRGVV